MVAYPAGFLWGAALSGHQAEGMYGGGEHSDWHRFEHLESSPGISNIANADTADIASDFWHRHAEDFDLARAMGLNSFRTSLSWEKVEPSPGVFNHEVIQHYRGMLTSMIERGIRPVIALHHFVNPLWFNEQGGWLTNEAPRSFLRYATFAIDQLGDLCDLWITFNEPMIYISMGYLQKITPPQVSGLETALEASFQIARAHRMVTAMIHEKQGASPGGKGPDGNIRGVGLANAFSVYDPYDPANPMDRRVAEVMGELNNWAFVRAIFSDRIQFNIPNEVPNSHSYDREFPKDDFAGPLANARVDWLGVNYYMRWLMEYKADYQVRAEWHTPEGPRTDNGWNIYPEGLERVLRNTADRFPGVPLVVTENGLADARDEKRPDFIRNHLRALDRAVVGSEQGAALDVRGYFHWSLTDNFEWQSGFQYRFGLIQIDYAHERKRTPRPSAAVYRDEIAQRAPRKI